METHYKIKALMRSVIPEVMYEVYPCSFHCIQSIMKQFFVQNNNKEDRGVVTLYRGVTRRCTESLDEWSDDGFISFTSNLSFAKRLAGYGGAIIKIDMGSLPASPLQINYGKEEEYLLLPGQFCCIEDTTDNEERQRVVTVTYKVNSELIKSYTEMSCKSGCKMAVPSPSNQLPGKIVVFYRHIHDRSPDIVRCYRVPDDEAKALFWLRLHCRYTMEDFLHMTDFIPEYQDLCVLCKDPSLTKEQRNDAIFKMMSYSVEMALYDPKKKRVETLNVSVPTCMFAEFYPDFAERAPVIEAAILSYFKNKQNVIL